MSSINPNHSPVNPDTRGNVFVGPGPFSPQSINPVTELVDFIIDYNNVYEFHKVLAAARRRHPLNEERAVFAFSLDIRYPLRKAVLDDGPDDRLTVAALRHLLASADYRELAKRIASAWTREKVAMMEELDARAEAAMAEARMDEAGAELEQDRGGTQDDPWANLPASGVTKSVSVPVDALYGQLETLQAMYAEELAEIERRPGVMALAGVRRVGAGSQKVVPLVPFLGDVG